MQNFIIKINYININVTALRLLQMNMSEYGFCYIVSEYQKINGWCEPGIGNYNTTITSLKYYIGQLCGLSESGTNKLFKRLLTSGFLEKEQNKFRLTPKYFVLHHNATDSKNEGITATELAKKADKVLKKLFSEWKISERNEFTSFINSLKFNDVNTDYYFDVITQHYTQENTAPMSEEGYKRKIRQWLWGDYSAGKLRTNGKPKLKNMENLNVEDTLKEFARYKTLVYKPNEHTTFEQFRDNVETLLEIGKKLESVKALQFEDETDRDLYQRTITMKTTPGATKQAYIKRMAKHQKDKASPAAASALNKIFAEIAPSQRRE